MEPNFAYVIPTLETGGAELQTVHQLNYLWENGIHNVYCIVLCEQYSNSCLSSLKIDQERILVLKSGKSSTLGFNSLKGSFAVSFELSKFIKEKGITNLISILPYAHFCCRLAKLILFPFYNVHLSTYYRGDYYSTSPLNSVSKRIFNSLNSVLAYLLDNKTLFISKAVLKDIQSNFFIREPLVLPNSLPVKQISSYKAIEYIKSNKIEINNKYLILFPGRFHRQKGHEFFISSLRRFIDSEELVNKRMLVFLVGDGPERERITGLINELGLQDRFIFTGVLENDTLLSLHKVVDLVVVPSINEGFGNVCIEGLMQESLMLVSDVGGLSEIIQDGINGFKFSSLDYHDFVHKFKIVYTGNHKVTKQGIYNSFINNYTIEKQVARILKHCSINTM